LRAVRVAAPDVLEIADVPEPSPAGHYEVSVDQVGICGTDTKILAGKIPVDYPRIMGHEVVGEIASTSPDGHFTPGTRVLVDPVVACGWCDLCVSARPHLCRNGGLLGRDVDGVFAERILVPEARLVPVPGSISRKASGLLQVLGTCVHAMKRIEPFPGRVAAVIGLGVAGQLLAQMLALDGSTVVGITRSGWKQQLALDLGAAAVADPSRAGKVIDEFTEGRGPDLVVEAVGTEATLAQAIEMVGIGGEILAFGIITGGSRGLPYYHLYHKELTIHHPRAALLGDYADGIALAASGALRLEPIVTHELPLEEAGKAFELVHDPSALKVLMTVA
jgi:2-desacetyl-2-hydroxyethyl bacteriochlorophyllide A dehydrogenase